MIVVGNDIFDDFIKDDGYYVDKTEIIYELLGKSRNKPKIEAVLDIH